MAPKETIAHLINKIKMLEIFKKNSYAHPRSVLISPEKSSNRLSSMYNNFLLYGNEIF